ncbi:glycosyltransferase [Geminicoccaceae bacterium 1502E]|nr:glycosyltransferase [Geminicoccaceae bacterium 1502E]
MSSRPRALVVAPQPFFAPRGTPFSVYYRTLITAQEGYEVDLLCYGRGEDVDLPGIRIVRIPAMAWLGPIKIGPSVAKLFLDVFIFAYSLWLLSTRRYAFVHAHEESVFFLRFMKPIFGFKLIYDMHSSLPEQLRNYKFTESRLIIGAFEWLERTCLKAADAVITICPELAHYARAQMPDPSRHELIENSIFEDVKLARPRRGEEPETVEMPMPSNRRVVLYAGTFEAYQGLDILIPAFAEVKRAVPDAFLLMVGGSPAQVERYRVLAASHGIDTDDIAFTGSVPPTVARRYTKAADVLVSPRSSGSNTPLKIYEQLASGVPLVATSILSHTQVLDETVCFLAEPEPRSFAAGMIRALTDEIGRARVSAGALQRYREQYSRPIYETKMRRVLAMVA